jgi:hypothetical protein
MINIVQCSPTTDKVCAREQLKCSKDFNFIVAFYSKGFMMQINIVL